MNPISEAGMDTNPYADMLSAAHQLQTSPSLYMLDIAPIDTPMSIHTHKLMIDHDQTRAFPVPRIRINPKALIDMDDADDDSIAPVFFRLLTALNTHMETTSLWASRLSNKEDVQSFLSYMLEHNWNRPIHMKIPGERVQWPLAYIVAARDSAARTVTTLVWTMKETGLELLNQEELNSLGVGAAAGVFSLYGRMSMNSMSNILDGLYRLTRFEGSPVNRRII